MFMQVGMLPCGHVTATRPQHPLLDGGLPGLAFLCGFLRPGIDRVQRGQTNSRAWSPEVRGAL